jgi:4-amino-4-deoxychorismate lyase
MRRMQTYIETIKIENNIIYNIEYHNIRLNNTIKDIYKIESQIDLLNDISIPSDDGVYRCRVEYSDRIEKIEYIKQPHREFGLFKLIEDNEIEYRYKSTNRDDIDRLYAKKESADDIIIIKNSLITDTSIANIAIYTDRWYTPAEPLLEGTYRQKLIDEWFLETKNITIDELKSAKKIAIMNAIIGFYIIDDYKLI